MSSNITNYTDISYTFNAGSTVVSNPIKYHITDVQSGDKVLADLSLWEVTYELIDKDWNIVDSGTILNTILEIPSITTANLAGFYLCNIILKKDLFIDREYFIGLNIKKDLRVA